MIGRKATGALEPEVEVEVHSNCHLYRVSYHCKGSIPPGLALLFILGGSKTNNRDTGSHDQTRADYAQRTHRHG
jgi:hypothetical protein